MTQTEYEQKRFNEWLRYKRDNFGAYSPDAKIVFDYAFGRAYALGKQEKDAEGEEMLTVSRKEVMNHFREACLDRIYYSNDPKDYAQATGRKIMLVRLFGKDKCLPDDKADEKVDEKADENVPDETPSDIDSSEPNPAEPKFKMGDKVRYVGDIQPTYKGKVFVIDGEVFSNNYYNEWQTRSIKPFAWDGLSVCNVPLTDLEPYTEPDTSHETPVCENHSDNTSQKEVNMNSNRNLSQNIANCDKKLDNILKDSFRNEHRLNIATQIMSAILSNQMMLNNLAHGETTVEGVVKCIVDATMMYTDALITECEKGGRHD